MRLKTPLRMKNKADLKQRIAALKAQNQQERQALFGLKPKESAASATTGAQAGPNFEQSFAQGMAYAQYGLSAYKLLRSFGGLKALRSGKIFKIAGLAALVAAANYLIQNPEILRSEPSPDSEAKAAEEQG